MDVQITLAELALFGENKLDRDRATTLLVGDINALGRAESHLTTVGTVRQLIVDKDIGCPRGRKVESADREWGVLSVDTDGIAIITGKLSSDALALLKVRFNSII